MQSVTIDVYRGTHFISEKERPLRHTPDGGFGVTYRGAVYPLDHQRRIQLLGPSFGASECELATALPPSWAHTQTTPQIHFDDGQVQKCV